MIKPEVVAGFSTEVRKGMKFCIQLLDLGNRRVTIFNPRCTPAPIQSIAIHTCEIAISTTTTLPKILSGTLKISLIAV